MSHFEFAIPIQRKDLLEAKEANHYVVRHVYEPSDMRSSAHELTVALSTDRGEFVLDKFDLLYSALVHFSALNTFDRKQIWETVNKGYGYLSTDLAELLEQPGLDCETRTKYLNLLKMSTYLLCQLAEAFEDLAQQPTDPMVAGKGKRGKKTAAAEDAADWEMQRLRVLQQLHSICHLQLRRLWDPPVPDEDFVNVIGNVCYHFLALPTVGHQRNKALRDGVFQVLGEIVRSYGHSLSCSLKMLQMLQQHEHAAAPLAEGAATIATEYGGRALINDLVREIAGTGAEELTKDGAATRHYAEFLSLVAVRAPDQVLSNMCLLIGHLDGESYQMRNAVLSILGDMVSLVLKGEELEDKQKKIRDDFLMYLQDHMHDVHAFVRTKAIQIWRKLVLEGCVPLRRQRTVLQRTVGRLQDKSSNVRRAALQLLTVFLQANPFSAKLSVTQLEEQYKTEKAKLAALGVNQEEGDGSSDDDDDDDDDADDDGLLRALAAARRRLVASLAAGDWPEALAEQRKNLLEMLQAGGADDGAAAVLLMKEPRLLPGHCPQPAAGSEGASSETSQEVAGEVAPPSGESAAEAAPLSREELTLVLQALVASGAHSADPGLQMEIDKQRMMVLYFKDSVVLARLVDESIPGICDFLRSSQITDILEAISFFVTAFEFGLLRAMAGIRQMLTLIWSKEAAVKDAVVDAYKRLYIPTDGNERSRAAQIVSNFSALCEDATAGQLADLEQLVEQLVGSGHVSEACVQLLWQRFTADGGSLSSRRAALQLIGMVASAEASVVSSNLDLLVKHGLNRRDGEVGADFRMVRCVCVAALKMAPRRASAEDALPPARLSPDHQLFQLLSDILVEGLPNVADFHYSPMAQSAVDAIYQLSDTPDSVMQSLLRRLATAVTGAGSALWARFLALLGHTAVCQMVHLDVHVFTELKRRNRLREGAAGRRRPGRLSQGTPSSASGTPLRRRSQERDADESMTGAAADDVEAEFIQNVCENHVVSGDGLLAGYLPLLVQVNSQPDRYPDHQLRAAAALALAKFMLVSSSVCEEHLQLLVTVLERSPDEVIRSNTVIALGDMSSRFPNLIEPWTPNIYARLRDGSVKVRKTTLRVLTHLILNDMVKVKGQISDVAERLVDDEANLRGMARAFFSELAQKGNALYNVLPDIVSRLSDPVVGLKEEDFHTVMQFVLGLIQKDRQLESLVEKLCHRLRAAAEPRQWRDLAFCLSLLNISDKCVKKLMDNFSCYSEKLHEKEVYECFTKIIAAAKKVAKSSEARVACEELEARLREAHEKAVEDDNAATGAEKAGQQRAEREKTRTNAARGGKKKPVDLTPRRSALSALRQGPRSRLPESSSEEEEEEEDGATDPAQPELSSSEEELEEQEDKENVPESEPEPAEAATEKRRRPAGRHRAAARAQPPPPPPQRSSRRRR